MLDPAFNNLSAKRIEGSNEFESGGCQRSTHMRSNAMKTLAMADANGKILGGQAPPLPRGLTRIDRHGVTLAELGNVTVWSAPAISASGARLPLHRSRSCASRAAHVVRRFVPLRISPIARSHAIGGLTTFVLVLIFTRPVVRLREAARQLAQGNLSARVREPRKRSRIFKGDEFDALVDGFNHMAERLESLVNAQKLLLRDVSHELRSPLAGSAWRSSSPAKTLMPP